MSCGSLPHRDTLVAPVWWQTVERLGKRGIEQVLLPRVERDKHVMRRLRGGDLLRRASLCPHFDKIRCE